MAEPFLTVEFRDLGLDPEDCPKMDNHSFVTKMTFVVEGKPVYYADSMVPVDLLKNTQNPILTRAFEDFLNLEGALKDYLLKGAKYGNT